MAQGTVKWFSKEKGYGFIVDDDTQEDIFVHYSAIQGEEKYKNLNKGQHVTFELKNGEKGLQAVNVTPK